MQKYSPFPIIRNVAIKMNLIKVSSQTSRTIPGWLSWSQGWAWIHLCLETNLSSELCCCPWKGTGYASSLLLLIPAALCVPAANQDAHKTQENYVFQLPQNPNYTPFSSWERQRKQNLHLLLLLQLEVWATREICQTPQPLSKPEGSKMNWCQSMSCFQMQQPVRNQKVTVCSWPNCKWDRGNSLNKHQIARQEKEAWVLICSEWGAGLG